MIRNMVFHISVVLLITGCGKDEEGIENRSPNGILIEVEAPQTNGWSTEEVTGTRSGMAKTVRQKGEYGVDMEVSTLHPLGKRGRQHNFPGSGLQIGYRRRNFHCKLCRVWRL